MLWKCLRPPLTLATMCPSTHNFRQSTKSPPFFHYLRRTIHPIHQQEVVFSSPPFYLLGMELSREILICLLLQKLLQLQRLDVFLQCIVGENVVVASNLVFLFTDPNSEPNDNYPTYLLEHLATFSVGAQYGKCLT